jgi:hypothetical protein
MAAYSLLPEISVHPHTGHIQLLKNTNIPDCANKLTTKKNASTAKKFNNGI